MRFEGEMKMEIQRSHKSKEESSSMLKILDVSGRTKLWNADYGFANQGFPGTRKKFAYPMESSVDYPHPSGGK